MAAGHNASQAEALAAQCPGWSQAPPSAIDIFARASARLYEEIARDDPQPFKQRLAAVAHEWACHRGSINHAGVGCVSRQDHLAGWFDQEHVRSLGQPYVAGEVIWADRSRLMNADRRCQRGLNSFCPPGDQTAKRVDQRLSRKRGHDRPVRHRSVGQDLSTAGVVPQCHEKKQGDDLPVLGDWPWRFVASHHVTGFLARYRIGQERYGVRQAVSGVMASAGKTQVVPVNRS